MSDLFWLLDIWYEMDAKKNRPVVHMVGFDEEGKVEITDSTKRPYCYADSGSKCPSINKASCVSLHDGLNEKELVCLEGINPSMDITDAREYLEQQNIQTYSADTYFVQVYMKDRNLIPCAWNELKVKPDGSAWGMGIADEEDPQLRLSALDIECYNPRFGMPNPKKDPIIVFGLTDKAFKSDTEGTQQSTERKLFYQCMLKISKENPDVIFTYNGNMFDWDYIVERGKKIGVPFNVCLDGKEPHRTEYRTYAVNGRPTIDLFDARHLVKLQRSRLPDFHKALQKQGFVPKKKFVEIDRDKIAELWDSRHQDLVVDHCTCDVDFT